MLMMPENDPDRRDRSAAAQKAALAEAEARCKARGEAWTPRGRVYELLLAADGTRKAYELMEAYKRRRPAAPPTVYRALDFLVGMSLAHRVESSKAFMACTAPNAPHVAGFLLCDVCGRTDELLRSLDGWTPPDSDFVVRSSLLEIHGTCWPPFSCVPLGRSPCRRCASSPPKTVIGGVIL